jgi:hypothetical protein
MSGHRVHGRLAAISKRLIVEVAYLLAEGIRRLNYVQGGRPVMGNDRPYAWQRLIRGNLDIAVIVLQKLRPGILIRRRGVPVSALRHGGGELACGSKVDGL